MWIVRLALRRTYTFVVVALLIAVLGGVSIYRMSTDIFPNIDIPVVSVVWQYSGMPADEIESRIIFVNERVLTASVNGIEHIESQSLNGVGVIRIYFHPGANVAEAETQVTATCQTLLKIMPPGITPPYIVRYSATSVPILQIAVSSDTLTEQQIFDYTANFVIQQLGTVQGARGPARHPGPVTAGAENGAAVRPVGLRPSGGHGRGQGGGDRGGADGPDDFAVPRLVAEHVDRRHLHPAVDPHVDYRPVGAGLFA